MAYYYIIEQYAIQIWAVVDIVSLPLSIVHGSLIVLVSQSLIKQPMILMETILFIYFGFILCHYSIR